MKLTKKEFLSKKIQINVFGYHIIKVDLIENGLEIENILLTGRIKVKR